MMGSFSQPQMEMSACSFSETSANDKAAVYPQRCVIATTSSGFVNDSASQEGGADSGAFLLAVFQQSLLE
jgi:hypothetical protein